MKKSPKLLMQLGLWSLVLGSLSLRTHFDMLTGFLYGSAIGLLLLSIRMRQTQRAC